jgi:hypothetical protein
MASNRSKARTHSTASAAKAETSARALKPFARGATRTQIAACSATELIARVADATAGHLRELTALPRAAAVNFDARVDRASANN